MYINYYHTLEFIKKYILLKYNLFKINFIINKKMGCFCSCLKRKKIANFSIE